MDKQHTDSLFQLAMAYAREAALRSALERLLSTFREQPNLYGLNEGYASADALQEAKDALSATSARVEAMLKLVDAAVFFVRAQRNPHRNSMEKQIAFQQLVAAVEALEDCGYPSIPR